MKLLIMRFFGSLALMTIVCSLTAQPKRPHYAGSSPHDFVEVFYSWYVPRVLKEDTTAGWNETLHLSHSELSPQLAKLLEEDSAAQSKCKDLIGLDFDPFLYTQEPAEHYEVFGIIQTKKTYRAEIFRLEAGERAVKPDVTVEFTQEDGHWFFVNFYYPGGSDLLTVLKSRPQCTVPRSSSTR